MVARLGFSIAAHVEFETLLLDEALSAGDATFRERCNATLEKFRADGRTLVIVSHGMESVRQLCDRTVWLDEARIREEGPTEDVVGDYEEASVSSEWGVATSGED
jgi:ABC-type polysaccharide/polyol phosphate transport system ATPase subunit